MIVPLILLLTTIEQFAIDVYLPSLPAMSDAFMVTPSVVQLTLTLYLLGFALSPLLFGPMSDRYGRRKILLAGMSVFLLASIVCAISPWINALLVARLLQGVGSGAIVVCSQSMVRDCFQGKRLVTVSSYMSMTWSFVPIIAPAIGGYVQDYLGWRANFILIALYAFLAFILLACFLPETMRTKPKPLQLGPILNKYLQFLADRHFIGYVFCTALTFAATIAFNTAAPFLFQQTLGLSAVAYGWLALLVALSYLFGTASNSVACRRVRPHSLIHCGLGLYFCGAIMLLLLALSGNVSVFSIALPIMVVLFAGGLIYPNAAALAFEPLQSDTGIASALYGGIQLLACALASAFVARIPETTALPLALILLGIGCLLALVIFYFIPVKNNHYGYTSEKS